MSLTTGISYLAVSVLCSVTVSVLLKVARDRAIDIRQAILGNYAVAAVLCWVLLAPDPSRLFQAQTPWLVLLALGVLLPLVFIAMANSLRHAGIVRSDAAQRLSLFIPLLAAFLLFGDQLTLRKSGAIILAFLALFCLLRRPRHAQAPGPDARTSHAIWMWPLVVWVGYGVIDILFKQLARAGTATSGGLLISFILAGLLMLGYLLARRIRWRASHLVAGLVLGLVNFGNILTYVRAHQHLPEHPALVFAVMNMGVITLGTLVGVLLFREPLSRVNVLGLVLALTAVVLMIP